MRKRRIVAAHLFGLALALASLTSTAAAQTAALKGNGKIAFSVWSYEDGQAHSGISVMNPDGSGRTQLTSTNIMCPQPNRPPGTCGPDQLDFSPAWSPDGTQIAFIRGVPMSNLSFAYDVYVMNADGSNLRRLTLNGSVFYDSSRPAWSPDATKLAFVAPPVNDPGNDYYVHIHVINADGSNQQSLGRGTDPAWSPDGSKLAFSYFPGINLMNPDGSGRTQITTPPPTTPNHINHDLNPVWSPDGMRLFFNRLADCDSEDNCASTVVWTVNADGSNPAQFADLEAYKGFVLSPDGTKILFSTDDDLFRMEAGGVTRVTETRAELEWSPSWQPVASTPTEANPIDDAEFFVTQHYRDFLSREPDAAGLAFWTNEIESCGANAQCREVKRVNISAAFFLSIEFQNTGYLVHKTYAAAFGRARVNGIAPLTYGEFLSDSHAVGAGVVVNQGDWQARLEANKAAYFDDFVSRAGFTTQYPGGMDAAQFVDTLNVNAGGPLSQGERDQLVGDLSGGAKTRAQVLRAVAENAALTSAEKNRAFVLMQYFGYLRRDPDPSGFNFWLGKLNAFNGNYVAAEMVKAFISSDEYRRRFGQP